MDESRVDFRVQELGQAITPVMRIGYLKWLSWLRDRVLERIYWSIYYVACSCEYVLLCSSFLNLQLLIQVEAELQALHCIHRLWPSYALLN
jgi:hypothetical protein